MIDEAKRGQVESNSFNLLYKRSQFELIKETTELVNEVKETLRMKLLEAANLFFPNINDVLAGARKIPSGKTPSGKTPSGKTPS